MSPFLQHCKCIYFTSLTKNTASIGLISLNTVIYMIYKHCVLWETGQYIYIYTSSNL